jgi:hypothetical protein
MNVRQVDAALRRVLADLDRAEDHDLLRLSMRLATTSCGRVYGDTSAPTENSRPSSATCLPDPTPQR